MSATKIKDIAVKVGEYTDGNGQARARYRNIGAIMEKDDGGTFMMLDVLALNPTLINLNARASKRLEDKIMVSMFDVRERDDKSPAAAPSLAEDDIPF